VALIVVELALEEMPPHEEIGVYGPNLGRRYNKYAAAVAGDEVAVAVPEDADRVLHIDGRSGQVSEIGPHMDGGGKFVCAVRIGQFAYGIPGCAPQVLQVDMDQKKVSFIGPQLGPPQRPLENEHQGIVRYWTAEVWGDVIYALPYGAHDILRIDASSSLSPKVTYTTLSVNVVQRNHRYRSSVLLGDIIFALPDCHGRVLRMNASTQEARLIGPHLDGMYTTLVKAQSSAYAFSARSGRRILHLSRVPAWDLATYEVEEFGPTLEEGCSTAVACPSGIAALYRSGRKAVLVDVLREQVLLVSTGMHCTGNSIAYVTGTAYGDVAYFAPCQGASQILRVNVGSSKVDFIGPRLEPQGQRKYMSAVTVHGIVYALPANAQKVLRMCLSCSGDQVVTACEFYFIPREAVLDGLDGQLPRMQDLRRRNALVRRRIDLTDTIHGRGYGNVCAVSHRWEKPRIPDPEGTQMVVLRKYLLENPCIEYVWIDYACLPQPPRDPSEEKEFALMLEHLWFVYISARVLIMLDMMYPSRFWPQFESWLSMHTATADGLVPAAPEEQRWAVKPLHDTNSNFIAALEETWHHRTAEQAYERLAKPDVAVTNRSDKEVQLTVLCGMNEKVRRAATRRVHKLLRINQEDGQEPNLNEKRVEKAVQTDPAVEPEASFHTNGVSASGRAALPSKDDQELDWLFLWLMCILAVVQNQWLSHPSITFGIVVVLVLWKVARMNSFLALACSRSSHSAHEE